jgi:hypothetical protein
MGKTLNWREVTGLENPGGLLLSEAWPASQMQPTPAPAHLPMPLFQVLLQRLANLRAANG